MDLFSQGKIPNLLPYDGIVEDYGIVFGRSDADAAFEYLMENIAWKNDEARIFGKHIITRRKVAWYGDTNFTYTYSGTTRSALPWTDQLTSLRATVERLTGASYNSCLLNLYHTGTEGMAWHSDDEKMLARESPIASVTFGAERKFAFRHKKTGETVSLVLHHGSLLVMRDKTQACWLHRLPPTTRVTRPRINLTFRTIIPPEL